MKLKAFFDEDAISTLETVHERRRMQPCTLCDGIGVEGTGMFVVSERRGASGRRLESSHAHIRCWLKVHGRESFWALTQEQRNCATLREMRPYGLAWVRRWLRGGR